MKRFSALALALALVALPLSSMAQGGLLGKKGGGSSGNSSGGSSGGSKGDSKPPKTEERPKSGGGSGSTSGSSSSTSSEGKSVIRSDSARGNDSGSLMEKKRRSESRSGPVQYGSQNNITSQGAPARARDYERPRTYQGSPSLAGQVNREENVRAQNPSRYRSGYYAYDGRWRDDDFYFPHYRFGYDRDCVVSPWYDYPHLPGYLRADRIEWARPLIEFRFDLGNYNWRYQNQYDRWSDSYDLDQTLADLVRAFERKDSRALNNLVPRRSTIDVLVQDGYWYRMNSDDFYDLMLDAIESTRTRNYKIVDVRRGDGCIRVWAEHAYLDPWNRTRYTYHIAIFQEQRRGYELVQFEVRPDRGF